MLFGDLGAAGIRIDRPSTTPKASRLGVWRHRRTLAFVLGHKKRRWDLPSWHLVRVDVSRFRERV